MLTFSENCSKSEKFFKGYLPIYFWGALSEQETVQPQQRRRIFSLPTSVTSGGGLEQIRGPLGIWPWPILNVLLQLIKALRNIVSSSYIQSPATPKRGGVKVYELVRDEKGRIIEILEHFTEG